MLPIGYIKVIILLYILLVVVILEMEVLLAVHKEIVPILRL